MTPVPPALVETIDAFRPLSPHAREALAARAREIEFPGSRRIVPLFDPPRRVVGVVEGLARQSGVTATGRQCTVHMFRPGDLVHDRISFERRVGPEFEVVALLDVRAIVIASGEIETVGHHHPEVLLALGHSLARQIRSINARYVEALSDDVTARLGKLLLDFAEDVDSEEGFVPLAYPLTRAMMAEIVGSARPYVSSIVSEMVDRGIARRDGTRRLLVHSGRLRELVRPGPSPR